MAMRKNFDRQTVIVKENSLVFAEVMADMVPFIRTN